MRYYVVDVFAEAVFQGNPAGVCIVEGALPTETMQQIAAENNLSETAFVSGGGGQYSLRWFTPRVEMDLCGHATLGSAFAIAEYEEPDVREMRFETRSGLLTVKKTGDLYEMDFPSKKPHPVDVTPDMAEAAGAEVLEAHRFGDDLMLVLADERAVKDAQPDFRKLMPLAPHAVTITARGSGFDFVSRFFAPNLGIDEDPVTGSAHTILTPFWAERLGKRRMKAGQLSRRGGVLYCEDRGARVGISGTAVMYLRGEVWV